MPTDDRTGLRGVPGEVEAARELGGSFGAQLAEELGSERKVIEANRSIGRLAQGHQAVPRVQAEADGDPEHAPARQHGSGKHEARGGLRGKHRRDDAAIAPVTLRQQEDVFHRKYRLP